MDKNLEWFYVQDCYLCNGTGKLKVLGKETPVPEDEDCPICEGSGQLKILKR
jgi:DnaJ-class molecular chaperone